MTKHTRNETLTESFLEFIQNSEPVSVIQEKMRATALSLDKDPEFVADYLKASIVEEILEAMEESGVTRSDLAEMLGKTRQYVSRVLNENTNFTLRSIAEFSCALDRRVAIRFLEGSEQIRVISSSETHRGWREMACVYRTERTQNQLDCEQVRKIAEGKPLAPVQTTESKKNVEHSAA